MRFHPRAAHWFGALGLGLALAAPAHADHGIDFPQDHGVQALFKARNLAALDARMNAFQRSYEAGQLSELELFATYRELYGADHMPEATYDAWANAYPRSYPARLMRAVHYKIRARDAFDAVDEDDDSPEGDLYQQLAWAELEASLKLTPKPLPTYVVAIGLPGGSPHKNAHRKLLDKGLAIAPESFVLRRRYMSWMGDYHEISKMTAFMRESQGKGLTQPQMDVLQASIYTSQGRDALNHDDYAQAIKYYALAVNTVGNNTELMEYGAAIKMANNLTFSYQEAKQFEHAVAAAEWALSIAGGNVDEAATARAEHGFALMQLGKTEPAVADYEAAAQQGNAWAQNELGQLYLAGQYVQQDKERAKTLFRQAARQGMAVAKTNLARAERS